MFLVLHLLFALCAVPIYAAEEPALNLTGAAPVPEGYQVRDTVLSPDKQKTAYILFKKDEEEGRDRFYVFFQGELGRPYDAVNNVVFSPEGRLVYCAKKGEKEYFVLDGKESPPYDSV